MWYTNKHGNIILKQSNGTFVSITGTGGIVSPDSVWPMTEDESKAYWDKEHSKSKVWGGKSYNALVGGCDGTKANDKHIHRGN